MFNISNSHSILGVDSHTLVPHLPRICRLLIGRFWCSRRLCIRPITTWCRSIAALARDKLLRQVNHLLLGKHRRQPIHVIGGTEGLRRQVLILSRVKLKVLVLIETEMGLFATVLARYQYKWAIAATQWKTCHKRPTLQETNLSLFLQF